MPTSNDAQLQELERVGRKRLAALNRPRRFVWKPRQPTAEEKLARALLFHSPAVNRTFLALSVSPTLVAIVAGWLADSVGLGLVLGILGTSLAMLGFLLAAGPWSRSVLARERASLEALPFAVAGWFTMLERAPTSGHLTAVLTFVDVQPDRATLERLAIALGGALSSKGLVSPHVEQSHGIDDPTPTNALYFTWQRKVLHEVQVLHQRTPVRFVSFTRDS